MVQLLTVVKGAFSDGRQALGQAHALQLDTVHKRPIPDGFHTGGYFTSRAVTEVKVEKGRTLNDSSEAMPAEARDEYEFTGWQDEIGKEFTADTPVDDNMTVYAQWQCGHKSVDDITTWTKTKDGAVTRQPTCTEAGSKEIFCAVCGEKLYDKPVAENGHKPGEAVVTAPKCLEEGSEVVKCTVCQTELSNTKIDSYGGHDEYYTEDKNGVVVREATEEENGLMRWTCHRDGCGATREASIPRLMPEPVPGPPAAPVIPIIQPEPDTQPSVPDEPSQVPDGPEESEEISDDEPPLAEEPNLPDDPEESEEILDDDLPLAEGPNLPDDLAESEEILDDDPPLMEEPNLTEAPSEVPQSTPSADNGEEEIEEPDVPRSEVPQTGDQLVFWLGAAALSGSGLILVNAMGRKRKDEDGK